MTPAFSISNLPRIRFGYGVLSQVPALVGSFGKSVLIITGRRAFRETRYFGQLMDELRRNGIGIAEAIVDAEPSPQLVDDLVRLHRGSGIEVVLAVGGGSVLDAAKAVAGLLPTGRSVMDYLEGVGPELPYEGPAVPFLAVPTTAGTGSEATKNAVLSVQGKGGFKKSFRHDLLVPRCAIVDPALLATCPAELIAANGMDALTQLLESYVSLRANPLTDALALSGIEAVRDGLLDWYTNGPAATSSHERMAYAALLSGITLAQVGLGSVHGLASPLGAFFPIPHGVACGTLVAEATRTNVVALASRQPHSPILEKYAVVGRTLLRDQRLEADVARVGLVQLLEDWTKQMKLDRIGRYGMTANDIDEVVRHCRGSSMQTNPIVLSDSEVADLLRKRL